jgi:LysM repeat protein
MALRRRSGFLAGLIPTLAAGAVLGCGGDSPLDLIPTNTPQPTAVASQPTQALPAGASATAAPSQTAGPTGGQQEYTVQDGDTLGAIAVQFGVTVDAIVEANNIADPNLIVPGESLIIPAPQ